MDKIYAKKKIIEKFYVLNKYVNVLISISFNRTPIGKEQSLRAN